jgi:hypothetical protein
MGQTSPKRDFQSHQSARRTGSGASTGKTIKKDPLAWFLARQHGVISRQQAEGIGLTADAIRHRIRRGGPWQRILPGVYVTVTGTPTTEQMEMAALLYAGRYATITGLAALRRYGFVVPPTNVIDVLVPTTCYRTSISYVRLRRTSRIPARVGENNYIQIAPIPRAVVDAALSLTNVRDVRALVAGLVQQRRCTIEQLEAELGQSRLKGSSTLRLVFAEVAAGAESAPEIDLMKLITRARLPTPLYNPRLYLGEKFLAKPDAWWKEMSVAAEVDSREWHLGPEDWQRTMIRHDVLAAAGIQVLHLTPAMIRTEPAEVVGMIRQALQTGRASPWIRTVP